MAALAEHDQELFGAIDRASSARFTPILPGIRIASVSVIAARNAEPRIVQRRHLTFDSFEHTIDRDGWMDRHIQPSL
jgi:hypothetical protein